jgi:hypothetical protein
MAIGIGVPDIVQCRGGGYPVSRMLDPPWRTNLQESTGLERML